MQKVISYLIKFSVVMIVLSLVGQQVSATKGDVERALDLLRQARAAIGGESTINTVQNLSINGKSSRQLRTPGGADKQLNGDFELNMILPDKLIRIEKLTMGDADGKAGVDVLEDKKVEVRDVRVKVVRADGSAPGENASRQHDQSDIARYMIGLLLTPPPSFTASFNYAGEANVEGTRADIIEATNANGFTMKLYLDKSSHLPLMMSYKGSHPRIPVDGERESGARVMHGDDKDVVIIRRTPEGEAGDKGPSIVFERKIDDGSAPAGDKMIFSTAVNEDAEVQVRFSNFRSVGGLLLPHTFTHMINGSVETVWTVERYEINSPTINQRVPDEIQWKTKQN